MFDLIQEALEDKTFESLEDYNAQVMAVVNNLQDELNKARRYYLSEEGRKEFLNA